jgi:hypothetical protein
LFAVFDTIVLLMLLLLSVSQEMLIAKGMNPTWWEGSKLIYIASLARVCGVLGWLLFK